MDISIIISNFTNPPILFFFLGISAVELHKSGIQFEVFSAPLIAVFLSILSRHSTLLSDNQLFMELNSNFHKHIKKRTEIKHKGNHQSYQR